MNKKIWTILGSLIIISLLIGGYLFVSKKGFLVKKEITYSNSINSIENTTDNLPTGQAGNQQTTDNILNTTGNGQQTTDNTQQATGDIPQTTNSKQSAIDTEKKVAEQPAKSNPPADVKTKNEAGKIVDKLVSWGFQKSSGRKIDTIIVHSSYNSLGGDVYDPDKIINIYKQYEVSAHYLISRDGTAYRLVQEKDISWHAGVSKVPDGRTNVNDFSIGIEMINTMDGKYTEAQYEALNKLIKNLKSKYEIKYILGHDEIAPGRKTDPWGIQWNRVNR